MALTECIIAGVRRFPGEWFNVPGSRVKPLTAMGYVMPDEYVNRMPPAMAEMWRERGKKLLALTDQSLIVDEDAIDELWNSPGRILSPDLIPTHYQAAVKGDRPLRVLQITQYDPGSSVYRYHSAANTAPGVISAFVRFGYSNPHCHLRQWDGHIHRRTVEALAMTADVIHVHMDYRGLTDDLRYVPQTWQRMAITYHGSRLPNDERRTFVEHDRDAKWGAIQFGARPYHGRWGVERYLPIPMPVDDYAALTVNREQWNGIQSRRKFRIAHSPTVRAIKGTREFVNAVDYLCTHEGLPVEAVLIENMDHGEGLRLKATCDATFDSFWLGMQGSGLEAAAMGQAVLAGDPEASAEAADLNNGTVPWTFANDEQGLRDAIRALVADAGYYRAAAARVHEYVSRVHDYCAVGARYQTYLMEALDRGVANR